MPVGRDATTAAAMVTADTRFFRSLPGSRSERLAHDALLWVFRETESDAWNLMLGFLKVWPSPYP